MMVISEADQTQEPALPPTTWVLKTQKGDNVMTTITRKTATAGQKKQISRFLTDVLDKVGVEELIETLGLDNPGVQRVIEHGDEFAEAIRNAAIASLKDLSVFDKFRDEEEKSEYGYNFDYKPKDINEQGRILKGLFSGLSCPVDGLTSRSLPPNAEGWFAIPRWEKIAPTYNEAVERVLDLIKQTCNGKLANHRKGQLGPERLRQTARTVEFFRTLGDEQEDHDILIIPAQFGLRHRGRSVRRAREVFEFIEFGLDVFAVGIMLLTHPERLQRHEDLRIYCAGDEFDDLDHSKIRFDQTPIFHFYNYEVNFETYWFGSANCDRGSASGFLV